MFVCVNQCVRVPLGGFDGIMVGGGKGYGLKPKTNINRSSWMEV